MASTPTLEKFTCAMQHIYKLPTDDTYTWTSPAMSEGHRGRYLWTDAFAVLNFITLARETANPIYLSHARTLVSTVHGILGRTRDGSAQLPGATPSSPLKGGLRIGKEDEAGSDGDGQYRHYLTIWMFALNRLSVVAGESKFNAKRYIRASCTIGTPRGRGCTGR